MQKREVMMTHEEILRKVDHTVLAQTSTWEEIRQLCDDAMQYHTASICIPPCFVRKACSYLKGRVRIATVVGFPNGNTTTDTKVFETEEAILNGADEIDMVINIGALKEKDYDYVENEIRELKEAVGGRILKVIIETCFLTEEEKIKMCQLVTAAGADYIKTSTGFATGGATFEDVKLLAEHVGEGVGVKASGGISSFEDAEKMIELGAGRLGTSRLVKLEKAK
jgi:hypothetical protein